MDTREWRQKLRFAVPQLMTACRLVVGATALILALEGNRLFLIATLLTLGIVIGGLSDQIARWLHATTPFGTLFDGVTEYLTVVIAPWALTRALLISPRTTLQEVLLDLPLMTGAIRYARNGQLLTDVRAVRGLDAGFFAFVSVTTVFLRLPELLSSAQLTAFLIPVIALLSVLMIVPLRYPRLTVVPSLSLATLVLLAVMPFVETQLLTTAAVVLGLLYGILGHMFAGVPTEK